MAAKKKPACCQRKADAYSASAYAAYVVEDRACPHKEV